MARPLTPQTINTIAGGIGIAAVFGIGAYMYFTMAAVPALSPSATNYNLGVITTDLKAADAKNVFLKTEVLLTGGNAQAATTVGSPVTYSSDEIGKTDITQLGQ